jgi:hypothetical protein
MPKLVIEADLRTVYLTEKQEQIIVTATKGKDSIQDCGGVKGNNGSSKQQIEMKIYEGTGWEKMRFIQLCCRFAYKFGLVRL